MSQQTEQQNKKQKTADAHARYVRISPRKMRLVTDLVRGMWATEAVTTLQFTSKRGARYALDLIKSAMANGENNFHMKRDDLFVKTITCDSGPKLKRYMPRAQGRASEIRRPTSHIHVVLEERPHGKKRNRFAAAVTKKDEKKQNLPESELKEKPEDKKQNIQAKGQVDKTNEAVKKNTVQQKRRLFNRKSGS